MLKLFLIPDPYDHSSDAWESVHCSIAAKHSIAHKKSYMICCMSRCLYHLKLLLQRTEFFGFCCNKPVQILIADSGEPVFTFSKQLQNKTK